MCACLKYIIQQAKTHQVLICTNQAAAAAKSLQSCPTLCDPIDSSPSGSLSLGFSRQEYWSGLPFPFSNAWKWKVKVKSLIPVWLLVTPWTAAHHPRGCEMVSHCRFLSYKVRYLMLFFREVQFEYTQHHPGMSFVRAVFLWPHPAASSQAPFTDPLFSIMPEGINYSKN